MYKNTRLKASVSRDIILWGDNVSFKYMSHIFAKHYTGLFPEMHALVRDK